jgi:glutaredoxin
MRRIASAAFITQTAHLLDLTMKQYHIYVFTQESCPPCHRLKKHCERLTEAEQAELDFVPLKTPSGQRTALAEELEVELSPTLVVVHETQSCTFDEETGYEYCDLEEETVEQFVGAKDIIDHLSATLDAYTYSHPE